jgi:pyruvate dehydrogenase E1 component alpha subunit
MAELMGWTAVLPCRRLDAPRRRRAGFFGATGVVGGTLALGSALAGRLSGRDQVAVVFFGDGAVQGGIFVESVNLATLWQLPVILVCENNGFAEFTPRSAHTRGTSPMWSAHGWAATVDGNDVGAVRRLRRSSRRRAGASPFLLSAHAPPARPL